MGFDLNGNNINLEFYGLPGCGKSTVSKLLSEMLIKDGYIVKCASAETGNDLNPIIRRIVKLMRTFSFCVLHPVMFKQIKALAKKNGYKGFKESLIQCVNVSQKLYFYTKRFKNRIFVWDEGLTQAAVSLAVNGEISSSYNEEVLSSFVNKNNRIIHVYVVESIDTVLKRMEQRDSNNSRVEKLKNLDDKIEFLERFSRECEKVERQIVVWGKEREACLIAEDIYLNIRDLNCFNVNV